MNYSIRSTVIFYSIPLWNVSSKFNSPENFNVSRARLLNPYEGDFHNKGDCVVYWMSRDQRIHDNYALLYAQGLAEHKQVPLKIVFSLYNTPDQSWGTMRGQYM